MAHWQGPIRRVEHRLIPHCAARPWRNKVTVQLLQHHRSLAPRTLSCCDGTTKAIYCPRTPHSTAHCPLWPLIAWTRLYFHVHLLTLCSLPRRTILCSFITVVQRYMIIFQALFCWSAPWAQYCVVSSFTMRGIYTAVLKKTSTSVNVLVPWKSVVYLPSKSQSRPRLNLPP